MKLSCNVAKNNFVESDNLSEKHTRKINSIRSTILEQCTLAQKIIESILSSYFIGKNKNKKYLFKYIFFENRLADFSFSKSIQTLEILLDNEFSNFKQENPKIIKNLDNLRKIRNRLSHTLLDKNTDEKIQKNQIVLWYFEKGKIKEHVYNLNDLEKISTEFQSNVLNPLMKLLIFDKNLDNEKL